MIQNQMIESRQCFDPQLVGGKAASLGLLLAADFPIPAFYVVPTSYAVKPDAIDETCRLLIQSGRLLAVRSSSIDEDGANASFAGILESFLDVPLDKVVERIDEVRQSVFATRHLDYRLQQRLTGPVEPCPVILQAMLQPRVSGVAFSADPLTGDRNVCVVTAIAGTAVALVDGAESGQLWRMDRNGQIIERPSLADGVALLSDNEVKLICYWTRRAEQVLGTPQDVEWAIEETEVWLVQSRPITTLNKSVETGGAIDSSGMRRIWDNANISESYGGVTTPMTFSFARSAYEGVYRAFCRLMGVPAERLAANEDMFSQMLGLFRGRVYYNLFSWYRLIALLPGYASNRRFMEQMMGVREPMPDEVLRGIPTVGWRGRLRDRLQFVKSLFQLGSCYLKLESMARQFDERIDHTLSTNVDSLAGLSIDQLAAEYRRLERSLLNRWDAPLVNDFFTMICFGLLRQMSQRWAGDDGWMRVSRLLGGTTGMLSIEPAKRIDAMGAMVAKRPGAAEVLNAADKGSVANLLLSFPELNQAIDSYLAAFGDRCMEELKLETETLHDSPSILWRSIGRSALRSGSERPKEQTDAFVQDLTRQEWDRSLAGHPIRKLILSRFIRKAQRHLVLRENLRFQRTRVFGRVRRLVLQMGQHLVEGRKLDRVEDVFYLEIDELLSFIEGGITCHDLRQLAATRKNVFESYRHQPQPPERFETRGAALMNEQYLPLNKMDQEGTAKINALQGTGCYPGVVSGVAIRVTDPFSAQPKPGHILVAERTDPGWVMLFPGAAGVLVQRGSILSHSATLAREMGIPTIVGIKGLMDRIQDGDWIEMDAAAGTVHVVESPQDQALATNRRSAG